MVSQAVMASNPLPTSSKNCSRTYLLRRKAREQRRGKEEGEGMEEWERRRRKSSRRIGFFLGTTCHSRKKRVWVGVVNESIKSAREIKLSCIRKFWIP